jgi:hypothetical protein
VNGGKVCRRSDRFGNKDREAGPFIQARALVELGLVGQRG